MSARDASSAVARRLILTGHVQGVGFRPFVYRLAQHHRLDGSVCNRLGEVDILVQGESRAIAAFAREVIAAAPPLAAPRVALDESCEVDRGLRGFRIAPSETGSAARIFVPADQFMCEDCRRELEDPRDPRYRYPFINCTQCGPRYTLIERLPYDRPNTTLAGFALCADCEREYLDPLDRRYHAEPIACPRCGPQVELREGSRRSARAAALERALDLLREGAVLAVKGVGGYHLMCDAKSERSVRELRARKRRPDKPLAVMFARRGADGLAAVREETTPTDREAALIDSPARPIVLVTRSSDAHLAPSIAPGLSEIGVFLPYSPLHQLLLEGFGGPLVATSGNLSGEPVITDVRMAQERLAPIVDAFLHHDRPIARPADDSVCRRIAGRMRRLRIGRGLAPLEIELAFDVPQPLLGVGAHLKNCVALAWERRAVISPHIGTLASPRALAVFERTIEDLQRLYGVRATAIACDAHPGYASTRHALRMGLPLTRVWHHHAHAAALAAEWPQEPSWLVFTWDGVGLGADGTLWGGETFAGSPGRWSRIASFRPFRLPGGDQVAREPWRTAASLCWELGREPREQPPQARLLRQAWASQLNAPWSSAVGRLFDAAAALVLGIERTSYEAQGPMQLETVAAPAGEAQPLPMGLDADGLLRVDWAPLIDRLCDSTRSAAERAGLFHDVLAHTILMVAEHARASRGDFAVGLTGGVFQNRRLAETALALLEQAGFRVHLTEALPANDAGIAFGQIVEASAVRGGG
ncbi:MAG TPA: carbamoyltransferase HypF [Steroidobacteraceae bacterium]|nr:carbamoyltransferase HypF [Steroidobacteraceae bacterium]